MEILNKSFIYNLCKQQQKIFLKGTTNKKHRDQSAQINKIQYIHKFIHKLHIIKFVIKNRVNINFYSIPLYHLTKIFFLFTQRFQLECVSHCQQLFKCHKC